jgi:hypothetical protein
MNHDKPHKEMKRLLIRKSILLILYTLINVYFMGFNWKVFTVTLNINLGFGVVSFPPFIVLFLLGFIIIGILTWSNYITSLKKIIYELEQGAEIGQMKEKAFSKKVRKQLMDEQVLDLMKHKLGIEGIQSKQEELIRSISELKNDLKQEGQINPTGQSQKDN